MKLLNRRPVYVDYLLLFLGTGLIGVAINSLYDPNGLIIGGFTGVGIIVKNVTEPLLEGGVPIWVTNLGLNLPLFIIAIKIKGWNYIKKTIAATAMLSVWLYILPAFALVHDDLLLSAVFGGVLSGAGFGLVFLAKGTTGGSDLVASVIQHFLRHYSIVQIMRIIDGLIVCVGAFVFGLNTTLYAMIAIFTVSKVSDGIIEGLKYSKAAFIITGQKERVAKALMEELDRGVTGMNVVGMYSGEEKGMLYCVVSKKEIVALKEVVMREDPRAFITVADAREVLGEGFLEHRA